MTKQFVIIQARLGSTRLPGKTVMPLAGEPLLKRMIERVTAAKTPFEIVVATTTLSEDDELVNLCDNIGVRCFRGHPTDLLDRHYQAALQLQADVVAKIPSDCPLIDPEIIDRVFVFYNKHNSEFDFVSNLHPPSYPDGNDVEIMSFSVLEQAWREAAKEHEREHTTPFIWDNPERFRIGNVAWETGLDYSMTMRWTIDYPEDYEFIKRVYDELWSPERIFSIQEILDLIAAHPEIQAINNKYAGVNWYRNHLNDLATVTPAETKQLAEV